MSKTERFGVSGKKGALVEQLQMDHYRKSGLYTVVDLTADTTGSFEYENRGIDYSIQHKNWKYPIYVDAKGNLTTEEINGLLLPVTYLEIEKKDGWGKWQPGWFYTSQTDRIKHLDVVTKLLVYYDIKEMRVEAMKRGLKINYETDTSRLVKIYPNDYKNIMRSFKI